MLIPNVKNFRFAVCLIALMIFSSNSFAAQSGVSFSLRMLGGGWSGKNNTSNTEFESSKGGQLGIAGSYQTGDFYMGLSLQGGTYTFADNAPDQISQNGKIAVANDELEHSEFDLVFGYYLNRYFSLFADIKAVSNTWASNAYQQNYSGLGFGASGRWPVSDNWNIYGSIGVIPSGKLTTNDEKTGDGKSSAVDIGALYLLNKAHRLMLGVKRSNYVYTFDSGEEQTHSIGGVYFGYSYAFPL